MPVAESLVLSRSTQEMRWWRGKMQQLQCRRCKAHTARISRSLLAVSRRLLRVAALF